MGMSNYSPPPWKWDDSCEELRDANGQPLIEGRWILRNPSDAPLFGNAPDMLQLLEELTQTSRYERNNSIVVCRPEVYQKVRDMVRKLAGSAMGDIEYGV